MSLIDKATMADWDRAAASARKFEKLRREKTEVQIYLIGGPDAQKTNRWLAMTNDKDRAIAEQREILNGQIKTITVKELANDSK
jgi:hypothetical protein